MPSTLIEIPNRSGSAKAALARGSSRYSTVAEARAALDPFANLSYLFILKTIHREDPVVTSSNGKGTFVPGSISAEAHLFALDASRKYLGGFRFHATSGESVRVQATREAMYESAKKLVMGDLAQQTKAAFDAGVKRFGGENVTVLSL